MSFNIDANGNSFGKRDIVLKNEKQTLPHESDNNFAFSINNVVCSYSTCCHLNLKKIAMEAMHVEYRKENGVVNMKIRNPTTTANIWSSGKITCTGAKSEEDAYKAARRFCRLLQRLGFKVKLCNYRVVNVLATSNVPFEVDIVKLANSFSKQCSYEPELHPGATFTYKDIKTTLKIFTTGSITLTAPSVCGVSTAISRIHPILYNFKMGNIQNSTEKVKSLEMSINESSKSQSTNQSYSNLNEKSNLNVNPLLYQCNTLNSNIHSFTIMTSTSLIPNNNGGYGNSGFGSLAKYQMHIFDDIDEEFLP